MPAIGTNKWEEALGIDANSLIAIQLQKELHDKEAAAIASDAPEQELQFDVNEVRDAAKRDLNFLASLAMPTIFKYFFPFILLTVWHLIIELVFRPRDFSQVALGIPRGHGKTTLIKLFVLFCILFTKKQFIIIISNTGPLAENVLADIIDMLNEQNIKRVFGDWTVGLEKDTQNLKKFTFCGRAIILAAIGVEGSIRGLNIKNERPDVMIFEDIQTAEAAESKVQSDAIERWMIGTAMKAKSPQGCLFIFIANMYRTPYSILRKLKKNPKWIKFICGGILSDGTALWEELQPLEQLLSELDNDVAMGKEDIFAAEVLNDENAAVYTKMNVAALDVWPFSGELDRPQGRFIVIDPSGNKKGSDLVTIGKFDVYDAKPAFVEVDEGSYSPGETIKHALLMCLKTNTTLIGVESNAYQQSLCYWFDFICRQLGIEGIQIVELYSGSFSKNSRIANSIKAINANEIYVHSSVKGAVLRQMIGWNPMKRDNIDGILDILGYAPKMIEEFSHLMTIEGEIVSQEFESSKVVTDNCSFTNAVFTG